MISKRISENLNNSSWIRLMFEEGEKLRKIYGPDKVFDFTLGNPDQSPPFKLKKALKDIVLAEEPGLHRYMNNLGFEDVRQKVAMQVASDSGVSISGENIVMTCGAAGALNVVLKTILNPGDEVIVFAPFFVEYLFYVENHGGKVIIAPTEPDQFQPDIESLEHLITGRTKAVILNTPNNPTGVVYDYEKLTSMARILEKKESEYNSCIYVLSDEPYRKIVYDNLEVPSILSIFNNSIVIDSFSKSLAIPGERIGYIAANPAIDDIELLMEGFKFANRVLGYVNAPALFQKVAAEAIDAKVDVDAYQKRRDLLYTHLSQLGFSCVKPQGAFYLFPKTPIPDDVEFAKHAAKYNLLLVPGRGFGCPGHVRISYCVSTQMIENSLPAFETLAKDFF